MAYDYKQDFPLLRAMDVAYVDNAATAQRPQCVLDAENDFYCRHNANPLRGLYPLSVEATDAYEDAREAVRDFLGAASTQEIIFTRNTTESLNLVAYSYGLSHIKTGDEVVVSIMEHHSNLLPWQMVCRQTGATLKFMECEPDGSLDLHKVEQLITERTKLVALTQVSNVLGRQYPVREIAAMAHKKGAVIVVDGAQSTPHIPVNVRELGADFLAFSGHKLYGPMGIGGLYGRRELLDEMPPFLSGGEMIETVTREGATYAELPHKFEAGTVNAAGAAGPRAREAAQRAARPHSRFGEARGALRHPVLHRRRCPPARHQRDSRQRRREHPRGSPLRAAPAAASGLQLHGARELCLLQYRGGRRPLRRRRLLAAGAYGIWRIETFITRF